MWGTQRHNEVGEITLPRLAVIGILVFLTATIITSAIHELGIGIMTILLGGTVIHSTISWFWGMTNISGNLPPLQMFFVMEAGTLFVMVFMVILALYPEPIYTNITASILGFRNMIDGAPFLQGSDGYQAAQISPIGSWLWYVMLFIVFVFVMTWTLGYRIDFTDKWDSSGRRKR